MKESANSINSNAEIKQVLPHNLNEKYLPDLEELTQSSIYTINIKIDFDDDIVRVAGTEEVIYTNQEKITLDTIYFCLIPNVGGDYLSIENVMVNGISTEPLLEFSYPLFQEGNSYLCKQHGAECVCSAFAPVHGCGCGCLQCA